MRADLREIRRIEAHRSAEEICLFQRCERKRNGERKRNVRRQTRRNAKTQEAAEETWKSESDDIERA